MTYYNKIARQKSPWTGVGNKITDHPHSTVLPIGYSRHMLLVPPNPASLQFPPSANMISRRFPPHYRANVAVDARIIYNEASIPICPK